MQVWSIYTNGHFLGVIEAPSEKEALKLAAERWPGHQHFAALWRGSAA